MSNSPRFLVGLGLIIAALALFAYGAVSSMPQGNVSTIAPAQTAIGVNLPLLMWDGLTHAAIPGFLLFAGVMFVVQEIERKRGEKVG